MYNYRDDPWPNQGCLKASQATATRDFIVEDRHKYNFTVAICVIVSEAEQYFEEWLDFHLSVMKFENIYVYDNSDKFDLQRWYNNTRQNPVYRRVTVHHRPGKGNVPEKDTGLYLQNRVYKDCIREYGKSKEGPQHDYL